MPYNTYPYELPPLPYAYDALEPYIDAETMHFHHDKHFQTYIDNLNQALQTHPALQKCRLEDLLSDPRALPAKDRCAILRNGGGVYNHAHFFKGMAPADEAACHRPTGQLLDCINRAFGSFDDFKETFSKEAAKVFGSGWTVLALTPCGRLRIVNLANQETVLPDGEKPLLFIDVWEHAYYLQYQNRRAAYIQNIWNVLVFPTL